MVTPCKLFIYLFILGGGGGGGGANVLKPPASEGFSEGGIEKEIKRKSERAWRDFGSG